MTPSSPLMKWESKSALLAHLKASGSRTLVIGRTAEAPRDFHSISIEPGVGATEIGVISSGLGTDPAAVILDRGRRALVGHDEWLTWIDLEALVIASSRRLGGVFYEFLSVDRDDEIVVLHELGALRVDGRGSVKWAIDTDVVEDSHTNAQGNLVLTVMEGPQVVVSLESGKVSR